jgi:hypothetical protein
MHYTGWLCFLSRYTSARECFKHDRASSLKEKTYRLYGSYAGVLTRLVKVKSNESPEVSDEIENSEEEPSDDIAEDSGSDDGEIFKRPKDKKRKRKLTSILSPLGKENPKKKSMADAATQLKMTGALLKYTQPNISNVKDMERVGQEEPMADQGKQFVPL